jgi:hypothetical protein
MTVANKDGESEQSDEVLVRVGELVRDDQKDDPRFERVARGEVDAAELAELEVVASSDPAIAVRLEASRPLDVAVVDRITARLGQAQSTKAAEIVPLERRPEKKPASPWMRRIGLAVGPLALAAAMLVYVTSQHGPSGPELPSYSITATGAQAMRGPAEESPVGDRQGQSTRLRISSARDARFEIALRPASTPQTKIVAYAFTVTGAGAEPAPLEAKVEIAPEGGVRFSGSARSLQGAREIRIVMGEPTAIGKFDDALARASSMKGSPQVRVLVVPIDRE